MRGSWLDELEQAQQLKGWMHGYELRSSQLAMGKFLSQAIDEGKISLIEAPTGTGKTLAYLLAALEWTHLHQARLVISTYTLPLQEQILKRDLPMACRILGIESKFSMLKGMNHYLCLQKAGSFAHSAHEEHQESKQLVNQWLQKNTQGHRSEGPRLSNDIWNEISAGDECTHTKCSHYSECHYFHHRREALQGQVLVVNHHLLASHMRRREHDGPALLGEWDLLIVDEAHHLVDVMLRQLAITFSCASIAQLLSRLWVGPRGKSPARGWLATLKQRLQNLMYPESVIHELWQETVKAVDHQWSIISELDGEMGQLSISIKAGAYRLTPTWFDAPCDEVKGIAAAIERYIHAHQQLISAMNRLVDMLKDLQSKNIQSAGACVQEALLQQRFLTRISDDITRLIQGYNPVEQVAWIQWDARAQWQILQTDFNLSKTLKKHLFDPSHSVTLCSATLGGCQAFEPLISELDPPSLEGRLVTLCLPSNFDWERQSLLLACHNMALPSESSYVEQCIQTLRSLLTTCKGRALVLTTSMQLVQQLAEGLINIPNRLLLLQGSSSREQLLQQLAHHEEAVIIGADSFWEGIDLAGSPIRLVVITKLPFDVPSDPLNQAKAQALYPHCEFHRFALPRAVLKFQQGVGRLLRHTDDRGCVICLDSRLCHARYAKHFLKVLDPATWQQVSRDDITPCAEQFLQSHVEK